MLRKKRVVPNYPSGTVGFYNERENYSSFKAKKNAVSMDDLEPIHRVRYKSESIRERDIQTAEQLGKTLTLKISCPLCPGLTTESKALIRNTLYDVAYIDPAGKQVFVYLEGGREIDS